MKFQTVSNIVKKLFVCLLVCPLNHSHVLMQLYVKTYNL